MGPYLGWLVGYVATAVGVSLGRHTHTLTRGVNHFQQVGHLDKLNGLLNVLMVAGRLPAVAIEGLQIIGPMGADERRHLHFPANRNGTRTV